MKLTRVRISNDASMKLRFLYAKTGLTPNILLRIGFGLSLRDESLLDPVLFPEDGKELNRHTLTGEWDAGFIALLKEWLARKEIDINDRNLNQFFRAHLNRGAIVLSKRVKTLTDIALLD